MTLKNEFLTTVELGNAKDTLTPKVDTFRPPIPPTKHEKS